MKDEYWRSLKELQTAQGTPGTARTAEEPVDQAGALDRRRFLALAAASLSAAGIGCGRFDDRGEIVAYSSAVEGGVPGIPRSYASTLVHYPGAPAVLVTTREGRPVKLEGNPEHPASRGSLGAFGQAATHDLYNPERLRKPRHNGGDLTWAEADRQAGRTLEVPILVEPGVADGSVALELGYGWIRLRN